MSISHEFIHFFQALLKLSPSLVALRSFTVNFLFTTTLEEACVAERLTPRAPDLEVRGSSLARCVVSLDKGNYSTLSLFTNVYMLWFNFILGLNFISLCFWVW